MDQFLLDFINESIEHIESIEKILIQIEKTSDFNSEINEIFRSAHSVKGGASFFGFSNIVSLAHSMESLLDKLRKNEIAIKTYIVDILLEGNDLLREMLKNIDNESTYNVNPIIIKLDNPLEEKIVIPIIETKPKKIIKPKKVTKRKVSTEKEVLLDIESKHEKAIQLKFNNLEDEVISQKVNLNPEKDIKAIKVTKPNNLDDDEEFQKLLKEAYAEQKTNLNKVKTKNNDVEVITSKKVETTKVSNDTLRVNSNVVNKLMDITGELIIAKNTLNNDIKSNTFNADDFSRKVEWLVNELHNSVLKVRLSKIGSVFDKFPRIVRDISKQINKEASLEIIGSNVELDRDIINKLQDPITHLIRNALDHGIENSGARTELGKTPIGNIKLSAVNKGDSIVVTISDDGSGIDSERIAKLAVEKGMIDKKRLNKMTDREKTNLIFLPGFSSKDKASNLSGRGVGMDVVKTSIDELQGNISIESIIGKGSKVIMKLPVTVAIMPGIKILVDDYELIIPEKHIKEFVMVKESDKRYSTISIDGVPYLNVRESLIPIINFNDIIGLSSENSTYKYVVVEDNSLYAIPVTEIIGGEEIIIKPLPKLIKTSNYIGTTIIGNGNVLPILSIENIVNKSNVSGLSLISNYNSNEMKEVELHSYLSFRIASQKNFLIPLNLVEKVVKLKKDHILYNSSNNIIYPYGDTVYNLVDLTSFRNFGITGTNDDIKNMIILKTDKKNVAIITSRIDNTIDLSHEYVESVDERWIDMIIKDDKDKYMKLDMDQILYKILIDNSNGGEV